ncbi:hypothetical protein SLEP1_g22619 [Rubroshorea leprosula]|uniref:Uncharacterized protein n=1 Tax=Rubroshorea leprosula TaxID=152421 RepID=A0AAV5JKN6_9ROSI|nr:hypothetical protein SLEP1_g22619 [Rubroshorea leprosula]
MLDAARSTAQSKRDPGAGLVQAQGQRRSSRVSAAEGAGQGAQGAGRRVVSTERKSRVLF